jgi:hypothetical protein
MALKGGVLMGDKPATIEQIQNLIDLTSVSTIEAIGISVLASLISVAALGIIGFLYKKGLYEHVQNAIKKTQLNITGEWLAEGKVAPADGGEEYSYRDQTTLKQKGRDITGESLYTTTTKEKEEIKKFKISGFIKNDVVVGTYENVDSESTGVGSFTLIVKSDGKKLDGVYQIYNVFEREIQEWRYTLEKKTR